MLASLRAELFTLRRWCAAWALVLLTPVVALSSQLTAYAYYLTARSEQYDGMGTPEETLPTLLPDQLVIVATSPFGSVQGNASAMVLGALLSGGGWAGGTLRTALLQRPGRVRTLAGQAAALVVASAVAVAVTFLLVGVFSVLVAVRETGSWSPEVSPFPAADVVARGLAVCLLTSVTYGAAGLLLGLLLRSAGGAVAVALLWSVVVEALVDTLALQAGGVLETVDDLLPGASALTLTSTFGSLGGGPDTPMYFRVRPAVAVCVLVGYTAASLLLAAVLVTVRDVADGGGPARRRPAATRVAGRRAGAGVPRAAWALPVLAALRAELLVLRKRPVAWALVLATPLSTLLLGYGTGYALYRTEGMGDAQGLAPPLQSLLPGQLVTRTLNGFGLSDLGVDTSAAFLLLGALVTGSDWARGTLRTSVVQGPGRLRTAAGQAAAVLLALAAATVVTFVLAAGAAALVAQLEIGPTWTSTDPFPDADVVVRGVGAALLVSTAFGAAGLALGTLFRSSSGAIAAVLAWVLVVQQQLATLSDQLGGALAGVTDLLPGAGQTTLTQLFGSLYPTGRELPLGPSHAAWLLVAWTVASLVVPVVLLHRRDVT